MRPLKTIRFKVDTVRMRTAGAREACSNDA
jgi:hypothetical protein